MNRPRKFLRWCAIPMHLVQDGQETLDGVKKSWLLNGLFPQPEEQALPVDGYVPPKTLP